MIRGIVVLGTIPNIDYGDEGYSGTFGILTIALGEVESIKDPLAFLSLKSAVVEAEVF